MRDAAGVYILESPYHIDKIYQPSRDELVFLLRKKGFVKRSQNPSDRRSNTVIPTELAESLKDDAKIKGISILDKMLTGIPEEELHSFLDTLAKLCANMNATDSKE